MYSSYSFLTSALDGSGQRHALAALYSQEKDPQYPLDRRLGGPQRWSGQRLEEKSLASARDQSLLTQSLARQYTDWAIQAP
jgi:hypothetical protein